MSTILATSTFLMTIAPPVIAIIGELNQDTPNTVAHSIIRSIICIGCLVFLSILMMTTYQESYLHLAIMTTVTTVSVIQLWCEMHKSSASHLLNELFGKRSKHRA